MFSTLLYYASALVLIASLVLIHEFGHFIVARMVGVSVRVFSVGFGPRLFGVFYKGTDYRVSAIPFGGYVRMAGSDPFSEGGTDDGDVEAGTGFMEKPAWQRLLISVAGPAMNLMLPFAVFSLLFWWGEPQSISVVGTVREGSISAVAGLLVEDRITAVNGQPVQTWTDIVDVMAAAPRRPVTLGVERGGQPVTLELPVERLDALADMGPIPFGFGSVAPSTRAMVDDPRSPAGAAGLPADAVLIRVAGEEVLSWNEVRRRAMTPEVVAAGALEVAWAEVEQLELDEDGRPDLEGRTIHQAVLRADGAWSAQEATAADDALWRQWGLASAGLGIDRVSAESAAERAGLAPGDRLLEIDGAPVVAWGDVLRLVAASASGEGESQKTRELSIRYRRAGQVQQIQVLPDVIEDTDLMGRYQWRPLLGISGSGESTIPPKILRSYAPGEAFARGSEETLLIGGFMVEQIGKLLTGEAAPQKSLGGPLEIFRQTAQAAERGLFYWARHMGIFSISLGILNLLPVPVLDGGQALMYLAEWLRGRPLPLRIREVALQAGVIFLVLLTLLVLAFDIHRTIMG